MRSFSKIGALLAVMPIQGALSAPNPTPEHAPRAAAAATTFQNPVIWQDHPDLDVFRIGDVFYYSSSTFAYSPGAPVLRSYDLVNWEPVSHSVPELNFGAKYNLSSAGSAYVKGIWASSLRYRPSNDKFYWFGCVDGKTHIWTSPGGGAAAKNNGEVSASTWSWTSNPPINSCYYDCGILVDDDPSETMYVVYGNTDIQVAQLSPDGLRQVRSQSVYKHSETIEGARMYKINGTYYIFVTRPAYAEFVLKSKSIWGPYTMKTLVSRISGPLPNAGYSHQGGIVNTKDNMWYYVAFMDSYPGGRIPVVAPLTWTSDGWPQLVTDSQGNWGKTYPMPVQTNKTVASPTGTDEFRGGQLSHEWEWNHNPDRSRFRLLAEGGLVLQTADPITTDLFLARNTLTHRIIGPKSTGTFRLDISKMKDGDRAGAVLFRDRAAYIGVHRDGETATIVMVNGLTLSENNWQTTGRGTVAARGPTLPSGGGSDLWLRIEADITPAFGMSTERTTRFSYSTDGVKFTSLGPAFAMSNSWRYFTGYRYGVFNFATKSLGGQVTVKSFNMEKV